MRMIDQTVGTGSRRSSHLLMAYLVSGFGKLAALLRAVNNRRAVNSLHDLTDSQLKDIGLSRTDLYNTFTGTTFFDDPSSDLTRIARRRRQALEDMIKSQA